MPRKKAEKPEENSKSEVDKISTVSITSEMREAYLDYAMSVIVSRALPDVRDGLKPVHRRILYTMHGMGLVAGSKFRKSAAIVGDVLGKYHPHGDTAVYDAMVKLAQDFSTRYPLVWGQGNFGSIDGDSPAAMRYTEAKMQKLSAEVLKDIEKDTVNFVSNYDATRKEPTVLPSVVPTILLNGTLGIAVGMATKIPPHNLREVMDALAHLADNPKATNEDLLQYVQGPDFPTGGIIFNAKDIHHAYSSGRGGVVVRGETEITETKAGQFQIVVSSIPYQLNKADLISKIAGHVQSKKIEGIKDMRDESTDLANTRIVIDLKTGAIPQKVLNSLYKHTDLETTYHFNMVVLVDGIPQTVSLKVLCENFIEHRKEIITRRTKYDLARAEERAHILEGLKKALDHIDAIIKTIKKSKDTKDAHAALMKGFKLSDVQATAILEMRLQKLAGLERQKIEDELKEKKSLIKDLLKEILGSAAKIKKIIKDEFVEISEKYGDDRRTKVVKGGVKVLAPEDLIPEEENVVVLTKGGYIKRTDPKEYKKQKRGGVGVVDLNTKDEDFITIFQTASTHSDILFFTDKGKVYQIKAYEIPAGKRATKGKSIVNFLSISDDENVTSMLVMPKNVKDQKDLSLMMVTRDGVAKKAAATSFTDVRRSGIISIKLGKDDVLLGAYFVQKGDTVTLVSSEGQSITFDEKDIRVMGRTAGGVRGMKLKKGDKIIGADVSKEGDKSAHLLVMAGNGYGKKTVMKEYKTQKRGGSGIKTAKVTAKTGKIMVAKIITPENEEIVAISKQGQVIRVETKEIPDLGRQTQGVRIMKLRSGDSIASLTLL